MCNLPEGTQCITGGVGFEAEHFFTLIVWY